MGAGRKMRSRRIGVSRRALRAGLTMAIAVPGVALTAAPASAVCPAGAGTEQYCYALVGATDGATYNGVSANLTYTCMKQPAELLTQQTWLSTSTRDAFIETGIYRGYVSGGAGTTTTPTIFWGRQLSPRAGGAYQTWKSSALSPSTAYNFAIVRNSGGYVWQIYFGSRLLANLDGPTNTMVSAQAGAESHTPSDNNRGSMTGGKVKRNSTSWSSGFGPNWYSIVTSGYFSASNISSSSITYTTPQNTGC